MSTDTIQNLRAQIDEIESRRVQLEQERDDISFGAVVDSDAVAIKRAAEIGDELAQLGHRDAMHKAALRIAIKRDGEAKASEQVKTERKRAEKAKPIAERLAARGAVMDAALKAYCAEFVAIQRDIDELASLGAPTPSRTLVGVNVRRGHDAGLALLGDSFVRPVPPNQRHSFDTLLRGWALPAQRWIGNKLNNKAAKAA